MKALGTISVLICAGALVACSKHKPAESSANDTQFNPAPTTQANDQSSATQAPPADQPAPVAATQPTTAPTEAPAPAAAPLTDDEILSVLDAANDKEIEESKAVAGKLTDKDAKAFAKMMTDHHSAAKKKAAAVATKSKLTPTDNPSAAKIRTDTKMDVDSLSKLTGPDLDKAYVALMLKDHQKTLADLDTKIIPAIKNPDLAQLVKTDVRATVEAHLKTIEAAAKRLGVGSVAVN
jgi:putative membrane protein